MTARQIPRQHLRKMYREQYKEYALSTPNMINNINFLTIWCRFWCEWCRGDQVTPILQWSQLDMVVFKNQLKITEPENNNFNS